MTYSVQMYTVLFHFSPTTIEKDRDTKGKH